MITYCFRYEFKNIYIDALWLQIFPIFQELQEIIEYEERFGGIVLDPSSSPNEPQNGPNITLSQSSSSNKDTFYFSVKNPHASSPHYISMYYKKAHLVIRMLEFRIGQELMMQVDLYIIFCNIYSYSYFKLELSLFVYKWNNIWLIIYMAMVKLFFKILYKILYYHTKNVYFYG